MHTHRSLAIGLTAVAALSLAACSSTGDSDTPAPAATKGAITWSFPSQDVQVWADQLTLMRPIIEDAGYEFLTDDSGFDAQKQVDNWQSWIARGDVKAMGGFPLDPALIGGVTSEATSAGIPLIGYIIEWDGVDASTLTPAYEGGVDLGVAAGEWILDTYGDKNTGVAILGEFGNPYGLEQTRGFVDGLEETGATVTISELEAIDRNAGHEKMQSQLIANPDTRVALSHGGDIALGARQAILDSGVSPTSNDWFVGSTDVTDEILDLISSDSDIWRTSFVSPVSALADTNAQLLLDAAEGRPVKTTVVPAEQVTAENVDDFRMP